MDSACKSVATIILTALLCLPGDSSGQSRIGIEAVGHYAPFEDLTGVGVSAGLKFGVSPRVNLEVLGGHLGYVVDCADNEMRSSSCGEVTAVSAGVGWRPIGEWPFYLDQALGRWDHDGEVSLLISLGAAVHIPISSWAYGIARVGAHFAGDDRMYPIGAGIGVRLPQFF